MSSSPGLFASTRGYLLAALAGLLVTLPSLGMGFFLDDYAQLALVESWYPENAGIFNLYAFLGDLPLDPWWKHPEFKVSMWRPLSSVLLQLDNYLFGHNAVGYHVHSILWYLGVVAACGLLFSRILARRVAVLALLVFALDECHLLTAGWIANRHSMVAMVPSLLGVIAHLRWREDGWRPGIPLSVLGYALGLLGGEVSLGIMVYVFSYELLARAGSWRDRLGGLVPLATVGGTYVVAYKVMGYGSASSGFYLDPVGDPGAFLIGAGENVPVLLGAALLGFTSDLSYFLPELRPIQVKVGVAAVLALAALLRWSWPALDDRERRALRWLVPGAGLSMMPMVVAQPFDRGLIGPMVGGAPLIAALLAACWRRWQPDPAGQRWRRTAAALLTLGLAFLHLLLPTAGRLAGQLSFGQQWSELRNMAKRIPVKDPAGKDVVVVNPPDFIIGGFFPLMHAVGGRPPFRSWEILTLAPHDLVLTRAGSRSLELQVLDGQLLTSFAERFHLPASSRLSSGDVLAGRFFQAEVVADNGLGPTRVDFRFDRDLDDPGLIFLIWGEKGLEKVALPLDGQSLRLSRAPGAIPTALKGLAPAWSW